MKEKSSKKEKKSVKSSKSEKAAKKPKNTGTATEDEIQAAIAGQIQPRTEKGDKNQSNMDTQNELGRFSGRPVGCQTGLPVFQAWCYLFQENERRAKKGKAWTDEELSSLIKKDFPGRNSTPFDYPNGVRRNYNRGMFTKGTVPKVISRRYDEKGEVVEGRARTGGGKKAAKTAKGNKSSKAPATEKKRELVKA